MKIKKHGSSKQNNTELFVCKNCGCEFEAKEDEYYIDSLTTSSSGISTNYYIYSTANNYITSCPECHKIVKKTKEKLNQPITVAYSTEGNANK